MLGSLVQSMHCEVCGSELHYDSISTFEAYEESANITADNIFNKVDEMLERYLVYDCYKCNSKYRYTYKDIEKAIRKDLFKKLLLLAVREQLSDHKSIKDGVLIYCGKCSGFDGQGSCPRIVYNECEIKRFPVIFE